MDGEPPIGPEQNFGAFMLTVGAVTIAFGSVFLLVVPGDVGNFLIAIVAGVTVLSLVIGFTLNNVGYFDG